MYLALLITESDEMTHENSAASSTGEERAIQMRRIQNRYTRGLPKLGAARHGEKENSEDKKRNRKGTSKNLTLVLS